MAAGLGYIEFATGDILTAAAANGYLASQTVMVFADSAARSAAITSPQEGMVSYLKDTNAIEYYSGSAWVAVGGGGGSGKVLQVVSGATTTLATSASGTYITSGITATITPTSATSTIFVIISTLVGKGGNSSGLFRLYRNGSSIKNLTDGVGYTGGTVQNIVPYAVNYVDSPASTSALTYALFFANQNGTTGTTDVNTYVNTAGSTEGRITLMEIGA